MARLGIAIISRHAAARSAFHETLLQHRAPWMRVSPTTRGRLEARRRRRQRWPNDCVRVSSVHDGVLPDEIACFIAEHIKSVEQLEILAFLRRHRFAEWSPVQVALRFRTSPISAAARIDALVASGLVKEVSTDPPRYSYHPRWPVLDLQVEALVHLYGFRPVAVIAAICARPRA